MMIEAIAIAEHSFARTNTVVLLGESDRKFIANNEGGRGFRFLPLCHGDDTTGLMIWLHE
jgi:hypothetical protein